MNYSKRTHTKKLCAMLAAGTITLSLAACSTTKDTAEKIGQNTEVVSVQTSEQEHDSITDQTADQSAGNSSADSEQPNTATGDSSANAAVDSVSGIEITARNTVEASTASYTANYTDANIGKVAVITFEFQGHTYEICITAIPEEFTEEQIKTLIGGFLQGVPVTISGDGLVDAEKKSNKLYGSLGDFVLVNEDRQNPYWGDNYMCWAASASNMLYSSGWADRACEINSELSFENEDDLFGFYKNSFSNKGNYQNIAVEWFFNGDTDGTYDGSQGQLQAYAVSDYLDGGPFDYNMVLENSEITKLSDVPGLLEVLKEGGAVGISVDFCQYAYPVKANPDILVSYNPDCQSYSSYIDTMIDKDDPRIINAFYCYNDFGEIVMLEEKDGIYLDKDGNEYDAINVLTGNICNLGSNLYGTVIDDTESVYCRYIARFEEDEIDFTDCYGYDGIGNGAHALTVSGYVIDRTETDLNEMVKGLFITDSDDDACIYAFTKDNYDETARPNRMVLHTTETVDLGNGLMTLNIQTYEEETRTLIAYMVSLKSAE